MGTPSYWILDPDVPDLLVLELDATGEYEEVARVVGDEIFRARRPFEVRVVPTELLQRLAATRLDVVLFVILRPSCSWTAARSAH
jgi:hypothetical protein